MPDMVLPTKTSYNLLAPALIVPPASALTVATVIGFPQANAAIYHRFHLPVRAAYRYVNLNIGTASGNIEVGVIKLSGTGHLDYTKVMTSGVIACPTAGNEHIDCGVTTLEAGDYCLFFFADNTTVTVANRGPDAALTAAKICTYMNHNSAGVPTSGTIPAWSNRTLMGLTLEQDV